MSEKRVLSPTEIEDEGWRGRIVGVTRIGGKAGLAATGVAALLVAAIAYGISTSGHHHPSRVTDGVSLTKASEQHSAWWDGVPDGPSSPPPLPTSPPRRAMPVRRPSQVRREFVAQSQVPEVLPMEVAPIRKRRLQTVLQRSRECVRGCSKN